MEGEWKVLAKTVLIMAHLLFFTVLNLFLSLLSSMVTGAAASATRSTTHSRNIDFDAAGWHPSIAERDDAPKVPLRILPLGASITWGYLSSTGNGYRKPLRDKLRFEGWEVDMVGSKSNGDMRDNVCISPSSPFPTADRQTFNIYTCGGGEKK